MIYQVSRPLNSHGGAANRGGAQRPNPRAFVSGLPLFVVIEDEELQLIADYDSFFDACDDDDYPNNDFPRVVYFPPWGKQILKFGRSRD